MVVSLVATASWAMLPAYMPNNTTVLTGGGHPIDGGRTWGGRRVLRDDKTWRDATAGTLTGVLLAVVPNAATPAASGALGASLPTFPLAAGFGLALGAVLGDTDASFIKRRSNRKRGAALPGLGQLDFAIGAFALAFVAASDWLAATFSLPVLAVVLVMTPVLHVVTNAGVYLLGLKNELW